MYFYKNQPTYNPQIEYDKPYSKFESRIVKDRAAYNSINSEHRNNPNGNDIQFHFFITLIQIKINIILIKTIRFNKIFNHDLYKRK